MYETLKSPDGKENSKTVLYFVGAKKALPLNLTNWDAVAEVCGEDTDNWPGGNIELYPDKTAMAGRTVDLRPRPRAGATAAAQGAGEKRAGGRSKWMTTFRFRAA